MQLRKHESLKILYLPIWLCHNAKAYLNLSTEISRDDSNKLTKFRSRPEVRYKTESVLGSFNKISSLVELFSQLTSIFFLGNTYLSFALELSANRFQWDCFASCDNMVLIYFRRMNEK